MNYLEWLEEIEEMLSDEDFDFAADTLEGIHEWVSDHLHITENQKDKDAVRNIAESRGWSISLD